MIEKKSKNIFKSGFIGLVGRTNVGKSTIINKILNKNVVITSDKAQTTRDRINCIYNTKDAQAIFIDCPGFFKPRNLLGKKLNKIIYDVLEDVDIIASVIDLSGAIGPGDAYVFEQVKKRSQPKVLIANKIDLIEKKNFPAQKKALMQKLEEYNCFDEVIFTSAVTGENINKFLESVIPMLPEGPVYYPENIITDMPLSKIIAEIVREKLSDNLFEELPHSVNVVVENLQSAKTHDEKPLTKIECSIFVEKKSHKGIIIGKSGQMLKKIGELSRKEIEALLETKVYLQLWVKIIENWTRKEHYLNKMGFN